MTLWKRYLEWSVGRDSALGVGPRTAAWLATGPVILTALYLLALVLPPSHYAALRLLDENGPVENLTFLAALLAAVAAVRTARRSARRGEPTHVWACFTAFGAGMFFIAGEEIAWGQQFLHFATPASWKAVNAQGETTLHNLQGMQGHTELVRLVFGVGGLITITLGRTAFLRSIAAPAVLLPLFLIIIGHSAVDAVNDQFPVSVRFDFYINKLSELIEMYIAFAGLGYAWYNGRRGAPAA